LNHHEVIVGFLVCNERARGGEASRRKTGEGICSSDGVSSNVK